MKDFNINMSEFDLLDPNNYTEEKNPILSTLFHTFINDKLGDNSDEVKKMTGKVYRYTFIRTVRVIQQRILGKHFCQCES